MGSCHQRRGALRHRRWPLPGQQFTLLLQARLNTRPPALRSVPLSSVTLVCS
ncbi:hypothetical protein J4732_13865 [Serratia marcescens]|uniref:Uncharacterized protein n=1 Tax=Serratia marcescens TaxID=615 RepID=A0A939NL67_SERMA|nr:hypothetical protein [Serratia marcescens]